MKVSHMFHESIRALHVLISERGFGYAMDHC